ncbi:hypothetical protein QDX91_004528 [Salmonella enterica]|nr:hypothetical protein [Salmonella enterica subsp. enterica serovar Sandiego]EEC0251887.1 hypothetical protein [Salmonella enterica subsp. enterica]EJW2129090.1 hypothetical protein [Salmonella enterica]EEE4266614.1 hypothetical protein [Salmonella enterica subsp. enterica serovar Sandiego]EKT1705022.1 hypothetical protein [Salmonella enterica]
MSDELFMKEAIHRAALLTDSLNPGKAIEWCREKDNLQLLLYMEKRTGNFIHSKASPQEISEFWKECTMSSKMTGFICCLGTGGHLLCRRGLGGDLYSIPVLHQVILNFITRYLQQKLILPSEEESV